MAAQPDPPNPYDLFAKYVERAEGGEALDFDAFCADHAEHADELKKLKTEWDHLGAVLDRLGVSGNFTQRLEKEFGTGADPGVSLEDEGQRSGDFTAEVLRRLGEHAGGFGRYKLKGEVARGGQGAVLRVWDKDLRRNLAMKVILGKGDVEQSGKTPEVDSRTLGRFLEEAQVTGQLDHPGIVPVHELGLDSEGRVYFTMKLVKGDDLKAVFEKVHRGEDGWTLTRALGVMLKVCEAMAYAHSKGVIHRDLKPANVMVGRFGEVHVMDWGLARVKGHADAHDIRVETPDLTSYSGVQTERKDARDSNVDSPLVTMDGSILGTPAYMPPEQAKGQLDRIDQRSDVYSVGAMFYHLLTGRVPYVEPDTAVNNYAILMWVREQAPKPIHELVEAAPPKLQAICEKAMARDSAKRYASMEDLGAALRSVLYRSTPQLSSKSASTLRSGERVTTFFMLAILAAPLLFLLETEIDEPQSLTISLFAILSVLALFGLHHLRQVLRAMRKGKHFEPENVRRARFMSVFVLWWALISFGGRQVKNTMLGEVGFDLQMAEIFALLASFVLFILAEAFEYGSQLQEQADR